MSNYTLNSARDVSESEVRAFENKIKKREMMLNAAGRTGTASYANWKYACQASANSKIQQISLGDHAPKRWHDIQANKAEILEHSSKKWEGVDADMADLQKYVLEADLKRQEREISLGTTLARTVSPDSEFAAALDELSKAMALDEGAPSALANVQQRFPSEMTTFLLADSRDNKGQFFESLLAATVNWEVLVQSSGMYNIFSHVTIDARSHATPTYEMTISNPEDLTRAATTDEEYAKRKGDRVAVLRRVAESLSVSTSSKGSRSFFSRARNELLPRQIKFRSRGDVSSQSGPADEQQLDPCSDDAEDSTSNADPFGDHARDSTSFSSDRVSSDARSDQGAHDIAELL